jgi:aerobic carbon-monoxide dehydrogenase medium subunit
LSFDSNCHDSVRLVDTAATVYGLIEWRGDFERYIYRPMYPEPIERYYAPTTVSEAIGLLEKHADGAKLLAGGQSLLPLMKAREIAPHTIIDLNRVREFSAIDFDGVRMRISALVRHRQVASEPLVHQHGTALADAADSIGDTQVRNRGTLIGNLAHADHTGDMLAPAIVLDGALTIMCATGTTRIESVDAFVLGARQCHLASDEIVTGIEFPTAPDADGSCYVKHGRVAQDRATLGVAVSVSIGAHGEFVNARVAIGGVLPRPVRVTDVEAALIDGTINAANLSQAGELAAGVVATQSDELASAAYRTQLIRVMVPECLKTALQRAGPSA